MRIKSPFKDYYDYMLQYYGGNDDILYLRDTKVVSDSHFQQSDRVGHRHNFVKLFYRADKRYWYNGTIHICPVYICNQTIPVIITYKPPRIPGYAAVLECIHDDKVDEFMEDKIYESYYRRKLSLDSHRVYINNTQDIHNVIAQIRQLAVPTYIAEEMEKRRAPIALDRGDEVVYNQRLADLDFPRLIAAEQLMQQIYVWFSNLGNPEKPIPKVDDRTLAEAKGFNKYSFRKEKKK